MADRTKPTSSGGNPDNPDKRSTTRGEERRALMRAKMALVAAHEDTKSVYDSRVGREHGTHGTDSASILARSLRAHPEAAAELIAFDAALVATDPLPEAQVTVATQAIADRAFARAFSAVFTVAPVAAPVVSLKAMRQARGLSMVAIARRLGLGVDVLSALEAGRVAVSTVPERLTRLLGEALDSASDQIRAALEGQGTLMPALQRSRSGATKDGQAETFVDFAELVRESPEMSADAKAAWLAGDDASA